MQKGNLILIGGIAIMALVIIVGDFFFSTPEVAAPEPVEVTLSSDALVKVGVPSSAGVSFTNLTPWQVVADDILVDTFIHGVEITDPNNVLHDKVINFTFSTAPEHIPTFFKTQAGVTTQIQGVTYNLEDGWLVSADIPAMNASRVYALNHYTFRNSQPVIDIVKPGVQTIAVGESPRMSVDFMLNNSFSVFGQEKGNETSLLGNMDSIRVVGEYMDTDGRVLETVNVLMPRVGDIASADLTPVIASCAKPGRLPLDIKLSVSYEADLYQRTIDSWLETPDEAAWTLIPDATQTYSHSYLIRQPFDCVAE